MLTHVHIRDFVIVEQVELALAPGMTVLTGETGAGKSILVDALGLVLGDRADSGVVRHGAERAEIAVTFDTTGAPAAQAWLEEQALDAGEECVLRRVITAEGRSKAFVNGRPVPLQSLRELGERLVDIHGQHEHQSLMRRDVQRELLDDYAGHAELLAAVADTYGQWSAVRAELAALRRAAEEREHRLAFLQYQVQELDALGLADDEVPALEEEHRRLANAGRLLGGCEGALARLYEDETSAHHLLGQSLGELERLRDIDTQLAGSCELLEAALIQLREGADELRRYAGRLELDPQRLQRVEQRIASLHDLARKHRVTPAELPALLARLSAELAELTGAGERGGALEQRLAALARDYLAGAARLRESRARAARELGERVSAAMQELGMPGGRLDVALQPLAEGDWSPAGTERVELQVSANPGHPLRALAKVASGGELSRISLAIQVIAAQSARIPTLVFDEVDTGIGGGVAEVVGRQLRTLGETRQVLCVTHLPQVAAQAHQHLQVRKHTARDTTHTGIRDLTGTDRVDEIARMLGGIDITEHTVAHAREMIERGQRAKAGG
jgi:DNA repair protein RecN (Recombination protein N)